MRMFENNPMAPKNAEKCVVARSKDSEVVVKLCCFVSRHSFFFL